jgi:starch synthase
LFTESSSEALGQALERAFALYRQPKQWLKLIKNGMQADYGWQNSAQSYLQLYRAE